jgi:hypothetical protein
MEFMNQYQPTRAPHYPGQNERFRDKLIFRVNIKDFAEDAACSFLLACNVDEKLLPQLSRDL